MDEKGRTSLVVGLLNCVRLSRVGVGALISGLVRR